MNDENINKSVQMKNTILKIGSKHKRRLLIC